MNIKVFENCTLIDGIADEAIPEVNVVVERDRIREVTTEPVRLDAAERFDLQGKTLMPGLAG